MQVWGLVALCIALSLLPVLAWGSLFLYKHNEKKDLVIKTFIFAAISVIPLVCYRLLWGVLPGAQLNEYFSTIINFQIFQSSLPLNLLVLFVTIGIVEEYLKHFVASKVDKSEIDNIDDAIEFSIIAALGFSFAENAFYFIDVYQNLEVTMFWKVVVFRSLFSTLAHVIFSSIYGYHFGLALFAKPLTKQRYKMGFVTSTNRLLARLLSKLKVRESDLFMDEQRFLGLFLAASLHAAFNVFLELNQVAVVLPMLFFGLYYVLYLISKKENHINLNQNKKRPDKAGLEWSNF
ncbi:PrsW family intramembrane metalloprotease [bacterium]|jgi:RsiW-degrading membrane proteinase PrsW (M82 family)|nr:PrsW family intramembrane metalloprotease [bacterium]